MNAGVRRGSFQALGGVYLLDTLHEGRPGTIGVYLVPTVADRFVLIEAGPGSTFEAVVAAIRAAGYDPSELAQVLVTHIHLDHAGAAGALAQLSGAEVVVHEAGARHLIDPSRLLASAARLFGGSLDRLWGRMTPVPEARLRTVMGGETLQIGEREIRVLYTPGHASHHVSYLLDGETLFSGDAAGIRLPGSAVVRPALLPPEVDLELYEASLERLAEADPARLLLTHFGEIRAVAEHLAEVARQNRRWAATILEGLERGEDEKSLASRLRALSAEDLAAASPELVESYQASSSAELTVLGLSRYWRWRRPDLAREG